MVDVSVCAKVRLVVLAVIVDVALAAGRMVEVLVPLGAFAEVGIAAVVALLLLLAASVVAMEDPVKVIVVGVVIIVVDAVVVVVATVITVVAAIVVVMVVVAVVVVAVVVVVVTVFVTVVVTDVVTLVLANVVRVLVTAVLLVAEAVGGTTTTFTESLLAFLAALMTGGSPESPQVMTTPLMTTMLPTCWISLNRVPSLKGACTCTERSPLRARPISTSSNIATTSPSLARKPRDSQELPKSSIRSPLPCSKRRMTPSPMERNPQ